MPYVLPNRKAFADAITRTFLKYRKPTDEEDKDVDLCLARGTNARELLPHQKIVRDYLMAETPYRGVLVYHGLGSGKTCSSIAVAESLLSNRKVFVMLPASLQENYKGELRKCGDPLYMYDQHWSKQSLTDDSRVEAKRLGISETFLERNNMFFTTVPGQTPNFETFPKTAQTVIAAQIDDIINQRFTFIRYDGLRSSNISKYVPEDGTNPYENSVVIIDEVHNFISRIVNASDISRKLYDAIYTARDCKVVALSGTPIINRPREIAFLMNLLRGPIERIVIPIRAIPTWDEERMARVLQGMPDVDTIEFNAVKKYVMVTRNPPQFRSVYNEKNERIAVQYVKDLPFIASPQDWVMSWKDKFELDVGGAELSMERVTSEKLECLPTDAEEFASMFLDGLNVKNAMLFQRRIQGLVSYFKGADDRMLPKRVDDDKYLEKVEMSDVQFKQYLEVRMKELERDSRRRVNFDKDDDGDLKSFRINSRLACNYAIPPELRASNEDALTEDNVPEKTEILNRLRADPGRYLNEQALKTYSPKLLRVIQNVRAAILVEGETEWRNQFLYSYYRQLEGLGVFSAILDANGWQRYRIVRENNQWIEDPALDAEKPAYAFYSGGEDAEEREYMRQIFNNRFADNFPASLKESVEKRGKKLLCLIMATSSGAEGITLENVRHVHIVEPHWNPARHDQVIGRAIRICSHARLPMDQRTVRISMYVSVFSEAQAKSTDVQSKVIPVRRADTVMKRYEGDPVESFMSTDEYLYEVSYEKEKLTQRITVLLKQAAVDCEIHRRLHSRETPIISCMRFDSTTTGEDLAFKPSIKSDELDVSYLRNLQRRKRRMQKVSIKQMVFLIDPDTKEVFDGPAFEDNNRLLRVGLLTSPTQIKWLP